MPDELSHNDLFLALTPQAVIRAVERAGVECRSVCSPLNSFENRVYLMELADGERIVSKFYRPQRWSREQILEEHQFLTDLDDAEVPVCPTLAFPDGDTVKEIDGIYYTLFRARGGRPPEELSAADCERMGMLVGRMHAVAVQRTAEHRITLDVDTYVWANVEWLEEHETIPAELRARYLDAAGNIADIAGERLQGVTSHRIHGDCHLGNLLERDGVLHLLDFDDMVVGPPVQDIWLALPGRDAHTTRLRESFVEGYERFREFDRSTLQLIEPLRGMRMIHYATWLAKRWHDPVFPKTWPHFGSHDYWLEETSTLEDIVNYCNKGQPASAPAEAPLTNADYFFDWED